MLYDVRPFDHDYRLGITGYFRKLMSDQARFLETIKIKVMYLQVFGRIYLADGKRWTGNGVLAAHGTHKPARKRRFAAA